MPDVTDVLSRMFVSLLSVIWHLAVIVVFAAFAFVAMIAMMIVKVRKG